MKSISIEAEEELIDALERAAEIRSTTVDSVIREALRRYLQFEPAQAKAYSFIGIGHSGKRNLSTQVDALLAEAAHRREGWNLPE